MYEVGGEKNCSSRLPEVLVSVYHLHSPPQVRLQKLLSRSFTMHTGFSDRQLRMRAHFIRHSLVESEFRRAGKRGKFVDQFMNLNKSMRKNLRTVWRETTIYGHMVRGSPFFATNKKIITHKIRHLRLTEG